MKTPIAAPIGIALGQELNSMHLQMAAIASGGGGSPLIDSLVAWWSFGDRLGTGTDSHTGGYDLIPDQALYQEAGHVGNCIRGTGGGRFNLTDDAFIGGDHDWSIAGWMRHSTTSGVDYLFGFSTPPIAPTSTTDYMLSRVNDDYFRFQISNGTSLFTADATRISGWGSNVWRYIVATHHAASKTIYVNVNNGFVDGSAVYTGTANATVGGEFKIMEGPLNGIWAGKVDEWCFFNKALSTDDIAILYNGGAGLSYAAFAAL